MHSGLGLMWFYFERNQTKSNDLIIICQILFFRNDQLVNPVAHDQLLSIMSQKIQCMIRNVWVHLSTVSFLMCTSAGFHKVLALLSLTSMEMTLNWIELILQSYCNKTCLMWSVYTTVINYLLTWSLLTFYHATWPYLKSSSSVGHSPLTVLTRDKFIFQFNC